MTDNADILSNATQTIEQLRDDIASMEREQELRNHLLIVKRDILARLTGEAQGKQRKRRVFFPVAVPGEEPPLFDPPAAA